MKNKAITTLSIISLAVFLGIIIYCTAHKKPQLSEQNNTNLDTVLPPVINNTTTQNTSTNLQTSIFETRYLKVTVLAGWSAQQASQTIYKNGKPTTIPNPAAVNITKGKYILYINSQAGQASGIQGGRFAEIAGGAPSADAVVTTQPSPPCGILESFPVFLDYKREDLYISAKDKNDYCNVPTNGTTAWYFSYITTSAGGYFNYYKSGETPALVITMAYDSKDVNKLPIKGSPELKTALDEMTLIIKNLELR